MDLYVPSYYKSFSCLGATCRHNCCIGWEIDIDEASLRRYENTGGALGEKLRKSICTEGETAHFKLKLDGRCPLLNAENLCEIILQEGEGGLCQICADHPRYRNFYSFGAEMGLGLCCEAAAKLILAQTEPTKYVLFSGDGNKTPNETEARFFELRAEILDIAFSKDILPSERPEAIYRRYQMQEPQRDWPAFYETFSHLHSDWAAQLWRLGKSPKAELYEDFPALFSYFLFRHFAGGLLDGRLTARLRFALHASEMILRLSESKASVLNAARQYAEEIEYSEENMNALLDKLSN